MTRKESKRIESITIRRMIDECPDTSHLGEYENSPNSDYSIDRKHATDCHSQSYNNEEGRAKLTAILNYLTASSYGEQDDARYQALSDAQDITAHAEQELEECNCNGGDCGRNECRYFNPNHKNYAGIPHDETVKYCLQDYARAESGNRGDWCMLGVRADAWIRVGDISQKITSGGLWGIESDSDDSYFSEIEGEQLAELRAQLHELGFSKRAIATACKNVERKDA